MYYGLYLVYEFSVKNIDWSSGIAKKIFSQKNCLEKLPAKIFFYNPYENKIGRRFFGVIRRLPFFGFCYNIELDDDIIEKVDFIYVRKPWFIDFDSLRFFKKIKSLNKNIKIIMEIPTFPYDYEMENYSLLPLLIKDKIARRFLYKYIDRIVTYSNDESIWGIKTIKISNGVQLDEELSVDDFITDNNALNIIAVSNLAFWHGYDRAIVGLYNYYAAGGKNIKLHIVGEGEQFKKLKKLASELQILQHVVFYGKQGKDKLKDIYSICSIGLDSLGRHRSKVYYNSSLKSKEYLMKGLLIVSGVENELDSHKEYRYYLRLPSDESPVDFFQVRDFYEKAYKNENSNKIRLEIIQFAKKNFLMEMVMGPVCDYIAANCSEK